MIDISSPTRSALSEQLTAARIDGPAAVAILAETAAIRHQARVTRATAAALAGADMLGDDSESTLDSRAPKARRLAGAVALCLLDACGIGGRMRVSGEGTQRVPAFSALGKGRKQASDGGAWSAAIKVARAELALQAVGGAAKVWLCPSGEAGLIVSILSREETVDYRSAEAYVAITPALAPWLMTIAREGLRRAVGLDPWFAEELDGVEFEEGVAVNWADLVNQIDAARERWATPIAAE